MSDEEEFFEDGEEEELNIPEDNTGDSDDEEKLGEEEGEEEEQEEEPELNPLTSDMMRDTLSMLGPIGDGLSHAYTRVDLKAKELTDINILANFIHLRHVIVSNNHIKDISSLSSLTHLLTLKADRNRIQAVQLESLPYVQVVSLSQNKIRSMEGLAHPLLEKINLAHNRIERISGLEPMKMLNLSTLDLRANKLESAIGEFPPTLRELYLPANLLKSVEGLSGLENLSILHLRDNLINSLEGFKPSMKSLQYVNLRGNQLSDIAELRHLCGLPSLRALSLSENPIAEEDDYRMEVLVAMEIPNNLERLDKDSVEWDEQEEARTLLAQKKTEELETANQAAESQPDIQIDTEDMMQTEVDEDV